jgi:serine acetyltransferase
LKQLKYFIEDLYQIVGKNKGRLFIVIFTRCFYGLLKYRIERSLYFIFGKAYSIIRLPFLPVFFILEIISNMDIHYKADIKGGLKILHPSQGVTISGCLIAGKNLSLVGGNVIGISRKCINNEFKMGNNIKMGANACIIGPLSIANNIEIGACACVTKTFSIENIKIAGVPAKPL